MTLWFSKIELSRTASVQALAPILLPNDPAQRISAQHNLMWSLFADSPDRDRDFLWREEGEGRFFTLSHRPPLQSGLFGLAQSQEYAPVLSVGDRLAFKLRVNATRMKKDGKRVDVVMDALYHLPKEERADQRMELASREGKAWLERQGEKSGFIVLDTFADDYRVETIARSKGAGKKRAAQLGIIDLQGVIEVTDPNTFIPQLAQGFGRAKAFGCGMMIIRRQM